MKVLTAEILPIFADFRKDFLELKVKNAPLTL